MASTSKVVKITKTTPGPLLSTSKMGKRTQKPRRHARPALYFCLDCDNCSDPECKHLTHPRKLIGDQKQLFEHFASTAHAHKRAQPVGNFVRVNAGVSVGDIAYHERFGNFVRKQFKKSVLAGKVSVQMLSRESKCRVRGCGFGTENKVDLFRHIRESHLKSGESAAEG